jgi:hypothetical protein
VCFGFDFVKISPLSGRSSLTGFPPAEPTALTTVKAFPNCFAKVSKRYRETYFIFWKALIFTSAVSQKNRSFLGTVMEDALGDWV